MTMAIATKQKRNNKFNSRIELFIYSHLSALDIAKYLKIGFWDEDTGDYAKSEDCLANVRVSRLEITIQVESDDKPTEYLIEIDFTFESDQSEEYLREKTVLFFGDNSSSLLDARGEQEIIETADYSVFELFQEV